MTSSSFSFSPKLRKIFAGWSPHKDLFALRWVSGNNETRNFGIKSMAELSNQPTLRGGSSGKSASCSFTQQSSGFGWRTESILRRSSR
jgi:hypothetical protein